MTCNDIEKLVRRYAAVSLVVPLALRNQEIVGTQDLLGVSEPLLKSVALGQILSLIRVQFPEMSPRWIIGGKVLSEELTLEDLSGSKYIHPNRGGHAFSHQVNLLKTQVANAESFEEIDRVYTTAMHLFKLADGPTEKAAIFGTLTENDFWDNALNNAQRKRLKRLFAAD